MLFMKRELVMVPPPKVVAGTSDRSGALSDTVLYTMSAHEVAMMLNVVYIWFDSPSSLLTIMLLAIKAGRVAVPVTLLVAMAPAPCEV